MKKIVIICVLVCSQFACYCQEIYSKMDARTLLGIMRDEGYSVSLDKDADIIWKKDGVRSCILFSDGNKEQTNFYFLCSFKIDQDKVAKALAISNEFNKSKRFGKSYVRKDAVVFNLPLNLRDGVTKRRIIDYLDDCQRVFNIWKKEVLDKI